MNRYQPVDALQSPRFCGIQTFMRLPNLRAAKDVDFAVVGVPFDTASSYRTGSRFGPSAIRKLSALLRPYNMNLDVNIYDHVSGVDYGDVDVVPGYVEDTYARIEEFLTPLVEAGVAPIVLGGDHSITLAELRAMKKRYGKLALVHLDSHLDTWDQYFNHKYNHGTTFRRAVEEDLIDTEHSVQAGMRGSLYSPDDVNAARELGFQVIPAAEMHEAGIRETARRIRERVAGRMAFLTFDIDFVDPAYAPGTGTIEAGGFTSAQTLSLLRELKDIPFKGFDVVEVLPAYDPAEITANLAANIGYEFISIIALQKKRAMEKAK
ncbi:MAG: agmatinase [Bacillota bacterium]